MIPAELNEITNEKSHEIDSRIKKARIRKNEPADPKTDKRRKENRVPTEKQLANYFKKGNPGNTARQTMRDRQKLYRQNMAFIASSVIPEMLTNVLYNAYEKGDLKTFMEAAKYVSEQAFGRAREWTDYDNESNQNNNNIPTINIMNVNNDYVKQQEKYDQLIIEEGENIIDADIISGDDDDL